MPASKILVLLCGGLCAVLGAVFILLKDIAGELLWLGIPIQLLGIILVILALRPSRTPVPESPTKLQAVGLLMGLFIILAVQFAYLLWWSKAGK